MAGKPVERILERLSKASRSGVGWSALCPAHTDSVPSLSIAEGEQGRVLLNCHRGCSAREIVQAVGLSEADLFVEKREPVKAGVSNIYDYVDARGKLIFQVLRGVSKEGRKEFRQRRPDGSGGWIYTTTSIKEKPLFLLPEVLEAVANRNPVWVVEGEKDVLALRERGITATCNPGGAGKWRPNHSNTLRNANVIVSTDMDGPGFKHAEFVRDSLEGIAASVRVVRPPAGKDVADSFEAGFTPLDFATFDLDAAIGDHDPFRLAVNSMRDLGANLNLGQKLARARSILDQAESDESIDAFGRLTKWDTFLSEPVEPYDWVIPGLLERSERVIVVAAEGVGKRLCLSTPLPTVSGWTTMGDVKVGDQLFDRFGNPTTVTHVGPVEPKPDAFRVQFTDGTFIDADAEHQWYVEAEGVGSVVTTMGIDVDVHYIPSTYPLNLPDADLPVDPYDLGVELGASPRSVPGVYLRASIRQRMAYLVGSNVGGELEATLGLRSKHQFESVTPIRPKPMRCISVDSPTHTYLSKNFIPTHNTMLARQVAIMSSAGIHPFNKGSIEPVRTLFVDLENPERIIRRTSKAIYEKAQLLKAGNIGSFPAHLLVKPDGIDLLKPHDRNELEQVVAMIEPQLLFLGPLYKSYLDPGGRTSEAVAVQVAKFLDYIRTTYGCALWLEHHAPLGTTDGRALRPFGSSVWSRWPEFGFALSPDLVDPDLFDIKHYRGMRDATREFPTQLRKGGQFPFTSVSH